MPARTMISASEWAEPGTRSAGLNTTAFPYARAGAIFQAGIAIGKFQGAMMPITPTGSRVASMSTPGLTEANFSPGYSQRFAGEEVEDLARSADLVHRFLAASCPLRELEGVQVLHAAKGFRTRSETECRAAPVASCETSRERPRGRRRSRRRSVWRRPARIRRPRRWCPTG